MSTDLSQFINKFSFTIFKEHFLPACLSTHHLQHWVLLFQPDCAHALTISLQVEVLSSPEHLGKSPLDLQPCSHSAEEGEQKQVWELSRQPRSHWPCKYPKGETGGEMHSLIHWGSGALFFYRQEWPLKSEGGAPGLLPWARSKVWQQQILLRSWWVGQGC